MKVWEDKSEGKKEVRKGRLMVCLGRGASGEMSRSRKECGAAEN